VSVDRYLLSAPLHDLTTPVKIERGDTEEAAG